MDPTTFYNDNRPNGTVRPHELCGAFGALWPDLRSYTGYRPQDMNANHTSEGLVNEDSTTSQFGDAPMSDGIGSSTASGGSHGSEKGLDTGGGNAVSAQDLSRQMSFEKIEGRCSAIDPALGVALVHNRSLIDQVPGTASLEARHLWTSRRFSSDNKVYRKDFRLLLRRHIAYSLLPVFIFLAVGCFYLGNTVGQIPAWLLVWYCGWLEYQLLAQSTHLSTYLLECAVVLHIALKAGLTATLNPRSSGKGSRASMLRGVASRRRASVVRSATLEVQGTLNGTAIVAIADTGACLNLISEKLAKSMGLHCLPGTQGSILLPTGRQVMSPGQVEVAFQFAGEIERHNILCAILPRSTREMVLGGAFLKATQTMTRHKHRLRKVASCHVKPSLNLIGAEQDFLGGYLDGRECLAVPDTGSDIMVISMEYARSLCLKIHGKRRSRIQFLDGSQALTEGIVRAKWQFGPQERPMYHEFHVLKGLPVSAILSSGVLDEFDVFRQYAHRIGSAESISFKTWQNPSGMGIFGISLVKRCEEEIKSLSDSFLDDITSDDPFTPDKIERERARRDEIRDAIAKIPDEAVRVAKQDEEYLRKWRWDNLRKRHLENDAGTGQFLAVQLNHNGTSQLRCLRVDNSNDSQATKQDRYGIKALKRFFY